MRTCIECYDEACTFFKVPCIDSDRACFLNDTKYAAGRWTSYQLLHNRFLFVLFLRPGFQDRDGKKKNNIVYKHRSTAT